MLVVVLVVEDMVVDVVLVAREVEMDVAVSTAAEVVVVDYNQ